MPNRNYVKVRVKEYLICNLLKEKFGFDIAQRTAGSHSPFDIIAVSFANKEIRLIQCKPESMSENQKEKIKEKNIGLSGLFHVSFDVI
jgi:hypothetical protein